MHQERPREDWNGHDAFWVKTGHSGDLMVGKSLTEGKGFRKVMKSHCLRGRGNWPGISLGQDESAHQEGEVCYAKSPNHLGSLFQVGLGKGLRHYCSGLEFCWEESGKQREANKAAGWFK